MSDRYGELVQSGIGKTIAKNLGLPTPVALERHRAGQPILTGEVLAGFTDSFVQSAVMDLLNELHANVSVDKSVIDATSQFKGVLTDADAKRADDHARFKVVVFDASGIDSIDKLRKLYDFFQPIARKIKSSGRVIIIGRPSCCTADNIEFATAQRALEGFVKSIAKEFKRGIAVNLLLVKKGLEAHLPNALQFFMSAKSAYVSGQAVVLNNEALPIHAEYDKPLLNKKIIVTGASRGIGAAISEVLAEQGAKVVCVDVPANLAELQRQSGKVGGQALPLDITDAQAGKKIVDAVGKCDGIVHNAGITKDKTLANMSEDRWQLVMDVNLLAAAKINEYLLNHDGFNDNARIVGVSSISGIAGNLGQSNYATSKAGVIGLTTATARALKGTGMTMNAVAPGFIETKMTAAIPFAIREAGRRMNSMSQGGEPVDVAQTIAWLLSPASGAINGQVVRVCGQSILGA